MAAPGRSSPFYTGCNGAGLVQGERSILYTSRSRPASPFPAPVAAGARSKDTPLLVLPPAGTGSERSRSCPGTGTAHRHGRGAPGGPARAPPAPCRGWAVPSSVAQPRGQRIQGEFRLPRCHAVPAGMASAAGDPEQKGCQQGAAAPAPVAAAAALGKQLRGRNGNQNEYLGG